MIVVSRRCQRSSPNWKLHFIKTVVTKSRPRPELCSGTKEPPDSLNDFKDFANIINRVHCRLRKQPLTDPTEPIMPEMVHELLAEWITTERANAISSSLQAYFNSAGTSPNAFRVSVL